MMTAVSAWLPNRRSPGGVPRLGRDRVAPMTVSPFAAWLLQNTDWRSAQLTIGLCVGAPDPRRSFRAAHPAR